MIPFDVTYHKPTTPEEAVKLYLDGKNSGKVPYYYNGGTEFISLARLNECQADMLIDLKQIPATTICQQEGDTLSLGSTLSLTDVMNQSGFPLLQQIARGIAHHTARNKISLGGNLFSELIYKETILPFLLADSEMVIATKDGLVTKHLSAIYDQQYQLQDGEFIAQINTNKAFLTAPFAAEKRTKQSKVNYPVISVAMIHCDGKLKAAFSGVCPFPFHREKIDAILNDDARSNAERAQAVIAELPAAVIHDQQATQAYRTFILTQTLEEMVTTLEVNTH